MSKSSVGRHFIKATAKQLKALLERRLDTLDLIAILIDGIEFKEYLLVVALGVDEEGRKHVLGLWQGATENTEVVTALLEDLVERGLSPKKNYLFVLDGAKALRKAVKKVFGEDTEIQRCQLHKRRNVKSYLPPEHQEIVDRRLRAAYSMGDYHEAKKSLQLTVSYLKRLNPSAARSLEEGLEETLTLHCLGVPDLLRKSLSSTNLIESPFSTSKDISRRVKRWRNGEQVQRWAAASLLEVEKRFRRINGYRYLSVLATALNRKEFEKERSVA
ncbi:MAG: transposase [Actinomycetota bacterium]|nr:transposase [Actinomycetota bacterium]